MSFTQMSKSWEPWIWRQKHTECAHLGLERLRGVTLKNPSEAPAAGGSGGHAVTTCPVGHGIPRRTCSTSWRVRCSPSSRQWGQGFEPCHPPWEHPLHSRSQGTEHPHSTPISGPSRGSGKHATSRNSFGDHYFVNQRTNTRATASGRDDRVRSWRPHRGRGPPGCADTGT